MGSSGNAEYMGCLVGAMVQPKRRRRHCHESNMTSCPCFYVAECAWRAEPLDDAKLFDHDRWNCGYTSLMMVTRQRLLATCRHCAQLIVVRYNRSRVHESRLARSVQVRSRG